MVKVLAESIEACDFQFSIYAVHNREVNMKSFFNLLIVSTHLSEA